MKYYTFADLLKALKELTPEELQMTATIYNVENDTYAPVEYTNRTAYDDVLDEHHPVIVVNDPENYHESCKTTTCVV
jgi:hypothetical protein